jgi:formate hydrogenlyase subunit 6/NADH:ubiquinone oxidoreductase subunit I
MLRPGLEQLVDTLARIESRAVHVYPQQCSKLRHRRSSCTLCADFCPVQAITWGESLQVDPDRCIGCGLCAAVCPTGALEAQAPTNLELLAQVQALLKPGTAIAFACQRHLETRNGDGERLIAVNCLGRLDESILAGTVCLGAEAVWLIDAACQDCPYAVGQAVAAQGVQRANKLLQVFGVTPHVFIGPHLPDGLSTVDRPRGTGETLSRRAFFSMLAHRTSGAAAMAATATLGSIYDRGPEVQSEEAKGTKKGDLPVRLPLKRQILLSALKGIRKPAVAEFEADGGPWTQFGFEEACTGCQMCAFFCPTGALSKIEEGGKAGVAFRISFCTNCRLCQDICYKEAVQLAPGTDLSQVLGDTTEVLLMQEVEAAPGLASPEKKLKRLIEAIYPKNE